MQPARVGLFWYKEVRTRRIEKRATQYPENSKTVRQTLQGWGTKSHSQPSELFKTSCSHCWHMRLITLDDRKTQGHEGVIKHGAFQDQFHGREHCNIRNIEARIQSKLCHLMDLLPSFLPFFLSFLHQSCLSISFVFFHFYWSIIDLNTVLASSVQQSESLIHTLTSTLLDSWPIYIVTEYWEEFPVLYSRSLLVICFIYSSVHMGSPGGTVVENSPTNAETQGEGCYPVWGLAGTCSCGFLSESSCWTIPAHLHTISHFSLLFCPWVPRLILCICVWQVNICPYMCFN